MRHYSAISGVMAGVIASDSSGNAETVMFMVLCLSLAVFCIATKISWKFNHDAMYSMRDEQEIQKIIMEDVLDIAKGVKEQTKDVKCRGWMNYMIRLRILIRLSGKFLREQIVLQKIS